MNLRTRSIILLILVAAIIIIPLTMYSGLGEDQGYFGGSDDKPGAYIESHYNYQPWFQPLWEPPSGEIESLLFAVQAAIGAIILGYFIGYFHGRSKCKDDEEDW